MPAKAGTQGNKHPACGTWTPAFERVRESELAGLAPSCPSRQPLRGFLRMRDLPHAIHTLPNAEERLKARLEARTAWMRRRFRPAADFFHMLFRAATRIEIVDLVQTTRL
jgi:hypothetical protein